MGIDLKSLVTTEVQDLAPLIIIYSIPDLGKSTFLARMVKDVPNAVLLQCGEPSLANLTEEDKDGVPHLPIILGGGSGATERIEKYVEFRETLRDLADEEEPSYSLIAFDNLDNIINKNATEYVIDRYHEGDRGKASGWGNKKVVNVIEEAEDIIAEFDTLRKKGVTIVLTFHARVVPTKDPLDEEYDAFTLNLPAIKQGSVRDCFINSATQILFGTTDVVTKTTKSGGKKATNGQRVLLCDTHPAYVSKNKFRLPGKISFDYKTFKEQMTKDDKGKEKK